MNHKIFAGMMAAALLTAALPTAAFAGEALDVAAPPANVTISSRPLLIAPNPQSQLTRGMLVEKLWELSGKPVVNYLMQFEDVQEGTNQAEAIRWAASEKLAVGYGNGSFGPQDSITREQLAVIVYQYVKKFDMGFRGAWMFLMPYEDRAEVSEWAFEPVMWMVSSRLFDPEEKELHPRQAVTQAEAEEIMTALVKLAEEQGVDFAQYGKLEK